LCRLFTWKYFGKEFCSLRAIFEFFLDNVNCAINCNLKVVMAFLAVESLNCIVVVFLFLGWFFDTFTAAGTVSHFTSITPYFFRI